jgi:hypothetical protein
MAGPDHESAFLSALEAIGVVPESVQSKEGAAQHTTTVPAPPSAVTADNLWRHPDAHPIALDALMLRQYGPAWLDWEAETLRELIPEDFKTPSVSELNVSKLQACKCLHLVDSFWERWEVFIACLAPFNAEFPDFETMYVPTVAQCLVAADTAARIRTDVPWSSEMKAYFEVVYRHDGIFLPLPPLDFVHLEMPEELNRAELNLRWASVKQDGRAPTAATPIDEQLRRLLVVDGYLEESRARLQQQLQLHAH